MSVDFVESVHPVCFQEVDQEEYGAAAPGDGVSPGHCLQLVEKLQGDVDVADSQDAPEGKHDDHWYGRFSGTPEDTCHTVGKSQQTIEETGDVHIADTVIDDLWIIVENGNELGSQTVCCQTNQLRQNHGTAQSESYTPLDAAVFPGTQILSDKSGQSLHKTGDGQKSEAFDFGIRTVAGHGSHAKVVDTALDKDVCQGNDGILNAGGQAETDDVLQVLFVEADIPDDEPVGFPGADQPQEAQQSADALGNGGCDSGGCYAHLFVFGEYQTHQHQVQNDIDAGGDHQIVQWMAAVAHGMEYAHQQVVHDDEDGTGEIIPEIDDGEGQNLFWGTHPPEDGGGGTYTEDGQYDTKHQTEGHGGVNGIVHGFVIFGTEMLGDDDTGTHGKTIEKSYHQKHQTAGGTDRCQGIVTDEIAYCPGVKGVIKLLKNISQKNGKSEKENTFPDGTFGQGSLIAMHEKSPPSG